MLYGLISDIHSNLEALEVVLKYLEEQKVDRYVCLGDLVGYGADPNRCIDTVRDLTDQVIAGNHDWASIGKTDTSFFNPNARAAAEWTGDKLTHDNARYLEELPLTLEIGESLMVHSTPSSPEDWDYLLSLKAAEREFALFSQRSAFIGHSHSPVVYYKGDAGGVLDHTQPIKLEDGVKYIINIGSIGQPRDGDPRASFALFDTDAGEVTVCRTVYPVKKAQEKILSAGLPSVLAYRLEIGR